MRGDGLAASDSVDAFIGLCFDADRGTLEEVRQRLADGRHERREPRLFEDDRDVDRRDAPSALADDGSRPADEVEARRVLPSRIRIGKMTSDVATRRGAEHRIAERMTDDVAVGV